jgi:hypothetical protein
MSGLFICLKLMPETCKPLFRSFMIHPIAVIYKQEVLENYEFCLTHRKDSLYKDQEYLESNLAMTGHILIMWWSKILIKPNKHPLVGIWRPLEFTKEDIMLEDTLITEDKYIIGDTNTVGNLREYCNRINRINKCRNILIGCINPQINHHTAACYYVN